MKSLLQRRSVFNPKAVGFNSFSVSGDEAIVVCPYHDDHRPSASFNIVTGLFYCFTCGEAKNAAQIAKALGGSTERVKLAISKSRSSELNSLWHIVKTSPLAMNNEYLEKRGVSNDTVEKFGIRSVSNDIAILIEDFRREELLGIQIRRIDENNKIKYLSFGNKTAVWPLWHFKYSKKLSRLFITEGIFGVFNAEENGRTAVATLGAANAAISASFFRRRSHCLLFDPDLAGYLATVKSMCVALESTSTVFPSVEVDSLNDDDWNRIEDAKLIKNPSRFLRHLDNGIQDMVRLDMINFLERRRQ